MNTLIICKMKKINFQAWKLLFDSDREIHEKMMKNTMIGMVDDYTGIIVTEVTNHIMLSQFMNSDDFKDMEKTFGITHEIYRLNDLILTSKGFS